MLDRFFADQPRRAAPGDLIEPLVADLVASLGWTRDQAAGLLAGFWLDHEDDPRSLFDITEDVQQWLHDGFLDTCWPACPRHHTHPLWLDDATPPGWTCHVDRSVICLLGELGRHIAVDGAVARANRQRLDDERKWLADMIRTSRLRGLGP